MLRTLLSLLVLAIASPVFACGGGAQAFYGVPQRALLAPSCGASSYAAPQQDPAPTQPSCQSNYVAPSVSFAPSYGYVQRSFTPYVQRSFVPSYSVPRAAVVVPVQRVDRTVIRTPFLRIDRSRIH